mgnify:CR=1 FL=1
MEGFLHAVSSVTIILLLTATGYFCARMGWMSPQAKRFISKFTMSVAIPCMCVYGLTNNLTHDLLAGSLGFLLVPFLSTIGAFLLSLLVGKLLKLPRKRLGVFMMMCSVSNAIFVGLPMCTELFGESCTPYVMLYYLVNTSFVQLVGLSLVRWAGEGGGVLLNQCPHQLDLWQWIFGMPNRVMGHCKYGHWHNIEVEDEVTAYAEYPNGATGAFITTTGECPGTNRLEITGDKGKLVWEEGKLTWWKLAVPEREFCVTCKEGFAQPEMTVTEVETDNIELGHNGILQNFTNAILYGEELLAPGYEGINGLNISNAIHLSDWTGKPQAVPVDGKLFLKYLNERRATSHVKEEKEDSGKIADLSGTYNDRWKVR